MLKMYGFSKVNAVARGNTRDLRVLWSLEEMQVPFEVVGIDHRVHDLTPPDPAGEARLVHWCFAVFVVDSLMAHTFDEIKDENLIKPLSALCAI